MLIIYVIDHPTILRLYNQLSFLVGQTIILVGYMHTPVVVVARKHFVG